MKNCVEKLGWPKCVGKLGWINSEVLEVACPIACTCLFKVRPGVLSKTLSHMWGKLNLPIFLFNVGLLTLINMDSLMFLAKPCTSLPPYYLKVILTSGVVCMVAMMMNGEGCFRCSLDLSPKVLEVSPIYSSSQVKSPHWNQYMVPLLLTMGSLSLGETSRFLMVLPSLKWVCMAYLLQIFLILSQRPCV